MLNSFKGRKQPLPQLGAYYPDCDILVLNPEQLRKYTTSYYIYVALHEYYHMIMHRNSFELEKHRQQFELDTQLWANAALRFLFPNEETYSGLEKMRPVPEVKK